MSSRLVRGGGSAGDAGARAFPRGGCGSFWVVVVVVCLSVCMYVVGCEKWFWYNYNVCMYTCISITASQGIIYRIHTHIYTVHTCARAARLSLTRSSGKESQFST
jgi:hypothetical protein